MRVGDVVLIEINEGERATFATLKEGKSVDVGKRQKVPVEALLGAPFGSRYEIVHNTGACVRLGAEGVDDDVAHGSAPVEERAVE